MRVERRKPKIKETVLIPEDLVLFLEEVHGEIILGEDATVLESDDLLQYEEFNYAYGGLIDSETGDYGFRYFTDDENGSTWDIILSKSEIEKIVNGEIKELSLWGCQHPLCGCKFSGEEDSCSNCDWIEESNL